MYIEDVEHPRKLKRSFRELLLKTDEEFRPPLSERSGTRQSDFDSETEKNIEDYLNNLISQNLTVMRDEEDLVGLLSYTEETPDSLDVSLSLYLSTIVISPERRKEGIAKSLIERLQNVAKSQDKRIYTRTWSTNVASQNTFESKDFEQYKKIQNDRGDNIHSIYYRWTPNS